jgi:DNA-binding beta-propeller fold protein YncE
VLRGRGATREEEPAGIVALKHLRDIELPAHTGQGGFDHAAIHRGRGRLYVAHTANDALDVIGTETGKYVRSIPGLRGVAGALVDEGQDLVFTSNRGESTVGILSPRSEDEVTKVPVGLRPNGLAYDPDRFLLLSANIGDPVTQRPPSVTLVDVRSRRHLSTTPMPGRTRWTIFDPERRVFFVNIADPSQIVVIDPESQSPARVIEVPAQGPHGLELDSSGHRLLCACDEGKLVSLDSRSGEVLGTLDLSGPPDVVFLNHALRHLYVAVGDPGVIDVIDIAAWKASEVVPTERGAHTLAHDEGCHRIYAFLPETHRASVFQDGI